MVYNVSAEPKQGCFVSQSKPTVYQANTDTFGKTALRGIAPFGSATVGDAILCRVVFYELDQTIHGTALQDRTMQGVAKRGEARQGYILRRH